MLLGFVIANQKSLGKSSINNRKLLSVLVRVVRFIYKYLYGQALKPYLPYVRVQKNGLLCYLVAT